MRVPAQYPLQPSKAVISNGGLDHGLARCWHALCGSSFGTVGVWVTANRAYYHPIIIPRPVVITQLGWENGGTSSGFLDIGIYTWEGKKIVSSGSTAAGTVSTIQLVNVTDTPLDPGCYFLAMSCDNTTHTLMREATLTTPQAQRAECIQIQDTAFPLPDTATFANPTAAFIPLMFALTVASV